MSERVFRFILGSVLILLLFLQQTELLYAYIAVLLFEGLTNLRIPMLITRLRHGEPAVDTSGSNPGEGRIDFDAERALRLIVALLLVFSYVLYREEIWFFPWFIGFMLFMAGMTNICPMVMGLRWIGFR